MINPRLTVWLNPLVQSVGCAITCAGADGRTHGPARARRSAKTEGGGKNREVAARLVTPPRKFSKTLPACVGEIFWQKIFGGGGV